MKKGLAGLTVLVLMAVVVTGCPEASLPTSTGEDVNFRFLISDEVNDIGDFQYLNVTISSIGVHRSGVSGNWTELEPAVSVVDLTKLQGENSTVIWSGNLTAGNYTKVFIYVSNVTGILVEGNQTANVKLPSDKLRVSEPFFVTADNVTTFVFDITVVKAGNSGKYILKPQAAQSGPDQPFTIV